MVSLRRRRLLGLSSGQCSFPPVTEDKMHSVDSVLPTGNHIAEVPTESSSVSGSSSAKEQLNQRFSGIGIRERPRVNRSKWEVAIKVEQKTIHLGTFESQEQAMHMYDRAAFMHGRKPNFELPEEEKEELRQLSWEEFLEKTRRTIANRRHRAGKGKGIGSSHYKRLPPS